MYYFRPKLSDGRLAPLAWQVRTLFVNVSWPLENDSTKFRRIFDKFLVIMGFIFMALGNAAELTYIVSHIQEIDIVMDAVGPYLAITEIPPRVFNMALRKQEFKKFLQEFYDKIYIERKCNDKMYRQVDRNMLPAILYSYLYCDTILGYFVIPVIGFFTNQLMLPYNVIVTYDYTQIIFYIPTLLVSLWLLLVVLTCNVAEFNLLATLILHLNARYLLLQQDCQNLHMSLQRSCRGEPILREFRQGLLRIIQRNVELNEFASKLQDEYSFRIFIIMGMSSITLCSVSFMMVTIGMSSKNIRYVMWFMGKVLELLVFGQLGSKLISTTDEMSSMYYMSNWEDVILQSTSSVENTQLMKLIVLAVEVNHKPMYVRGLNFFEVSLTTVVAILQGAYAYFSFLYAFR